MACGHAVNELTSVASLHGHHSVGHSGPWGGQRGVTSQVPLPPHGPGTGWGGGRSQDQSLQSGLCETVWQRPLLAPSCLADAGAS